MSFYVLIHVDFLILYYTLEKQTMSTIFNIYVNKNTASEQEDIDNGDDLVDEEVSEEESDHTSDEDFIAPEDSEEEDDDVSEVDDHCQCQHSYT